MNALAKTVTGRLGELTFGAEASSLHAQLKRKAEDLAVEQQMADALTLCVGQDLLTDHEERYLFKRIVKRLDGRFAPPPKPRPADTRWIPASKQEKPLAAFAEHWLPSSDTPLGRWIAQLSERQLCVLEYRLMPEKPRKTQAAIGAEYGVTGSTIRNEEQYILRYICSAGEGICEDEDGTVLRYVRYKAPRYHAMMHAYQWLYSERGEAFPVGDPYAEECLQEYLNQHPQADSWTARERRVIRNRIHLPDRERDGWWVQHPALINKTRETLLAHLSSDGRIGDRLVEKILTELKVLRHHNAWVEHVGGFLRTKKGWAVSSNRGAKAA